MQDKAVYCETYINYASDADRAARQVTIFNGRQTPLSFAENGFELIEHRSEVTDWLDPTQQHKHCAEIASVAKDYADCDWVLFYPALVRSEEQAAVSADYAPVQIAHSDYTEKYRSMLGDDDHPYRQILAPSMAAADITGQDIRNAQRLLTIQFWRSIGDPVCQWPLCFGDCQTFLRDELYAVLVEEYGGERTEFESLLVLPGNEKEHQWYTFPNMAAHEVVMFRAYDSDLATSGGHFWTPHTAFYDPCVPKEASHRQSIEMRAICGFN